MNILKSSVNTVFDSARGFCALAFLAFSTVIFFHQYDPFHLLFGALPIALYCVDDYVAAKHVTEETELSDKLNKLHWYISIIGCIVSMALMTLLWISTWDESLWLGWDLVEDIEFILFTGLLCFA